MGCVPLSPDAPADDSAPDCHVFERQEKRLPEKGGCLDCSSSGSEDERCAVEVAGEEATPRDELDPDFSWKAFRIRLIHMVSRAEAGHAIPLLQKGKQSCGVSDDERRVKCLQRVCRLRISDSQS